MHWMPSKPTCKFEGRHKDCLEEVNVFISMKNAALGLQNKYSSNSDWRRPVSRNCGRERVVGALNLQVESTDKVYVPPL